MRRLPDAARRFIAGTVAILFASLILITPHDAHAQDILPQANFIPHFDAQIPLDLSFQESNGQAIHLKDYFGQRPVILSLGYYNCPNLCDLVRQGLAKDLKTLRFQPGKDFNVVVVSIDPKETPMDAMSQKMMFLQDYGQTPASGIYFLTGQQDTIKQLADAVGFEYAYDAASGQFAHPSGIILLTPEGKISRYFYGIDFPDLRLGLVEASANKIGTLGDQILLRCFHYDFSTGKYTPLIMTLLQGLGAVTVVGIGAMVIVLSRRKRTEKA